MATALACQELVELVTDYLEHALSGPECRRVERHIAGCPNCTAYLDQLREIRVQMGRLRPADVSMQTELELRRALRERAS